MDGWIEYYLEQCGVPPNNTHRLLVQAIAPKLSNTDLSVQQLAGMLGISRRQLYRDIHTLLDKPAGQWIRELRLYKAQWLLNQQQVTSLKELVKKVGFKSTTHFRRIYQDFFDRDLATHFNSSPSSLTKKIKNLQ